MDKVECDRCKDIFNPSAREKITLNEGVYLTGEYDLCPKCISSFKQWLKCN
jgi:hypothetical protein